jgi:hypothetical protein
LWSGGFSFAAASSTRQSRRCPHMAPALLWLCPETPSTDAGGIHGTHHPPPLAMNKGPASIKKAAVKRLF